MNYRQLVKHYGGLTRAATALGLGRQTVHSWKTRSRIPARWQAEIEAKTDGALLASVRACREAEAMAALHRQMKTRREASTV